MGEQQQDEVITLSPEETEARLLSSVVLEFNDESLYLARDDRENLITFGDGQGKDWSIPFPEDEKARWKQMRRFRNLLVHGLPVFQRMAQSRFIPPSNGEILNMMLKFDPGLPVFQRMAQSRFIPPSNGEILNMMLKFDPSPMVWASRSKTSISTP